MTDIKCDKCDQRAVHNCGRAPNQTHYCNDHMPGWNELGEALSAAVTNDTKSTSGVMTTEQLTAYLIESGTTAIESDPDFIPTLHIEREGGITIMALAMDGHPYDAIKMLAPTIIQEGPIDRLVFVSDSYMWLGKEEDFVPGPLQPRFEAGDPSVSESLINVIMTANGTDHPTAVHQIMMPYTRTDDGVTWADIKDRSDAEVTGRMADLLSTILRVSHMVSDLLEQGANG